MAMPVAIIVLFVITGLTAAAISASVQTNSSTQRDTRVKSALAAAESGLQTGIYRLNMLKPENEKECVGGGGAELAAAKYCKEITGELGNNAKYKVWVSEELGEADSCVGSYVKGESIAQRCIFAVGVLNEGAANEVTRRLSERVAAFTARPLFEIKGLLGERKVVISNNDKIKGSVGSNGQIEIGKNGEVSEYCEVGPSGKATPEEQCGKVVKSETPFKLTAPEMGNTAEKNENYLITNYAKKIEPYDTAEGVEYTFKNTWEQRQLSMRNKGTLVLKSGNYNFCSLIAENGAVIEVEPGAKVAIYIDSANREGSGCKGVTEAGVLKIWNNATIINPSHNPTALEFFVYGEGPVYIKNNGELYATFYAPESKVNIENNGLFEGAVAAKEIELGNNFEFKWSEKAEEMKKGALRTYFRSSWAECTPYTPGSPTATC